jgi:hypothetical protein
VGSNPSVPVSVYAIEDDLTILFKYSLNLK